MHEPEGDAYGYHYGSQARYSGHLADDDDDDGDDGDDDDDNRDDGDSNISADQGHLSTYSDVNQPEYAHHRRSYSSAPTEDVGFGLSEGSRGGHPDDEQYKGSDNGPEDGTVGPYATVDVHSDVYGHGHFFHPPTTLMQSSDGSYRNIDAAQASYQAAEMNYKPTKTEEKLDKLHDKADDASDLKSNIQADFGDLAPAVQDAIVSSKAGRQLEDTLDDFIYGIPEFIDILGLIGKAHPFLEVVVAAFTTVYNHERARRGNDQKIMVVFVEMKEMLRVLLRLRNAKGVVEEDARRLRELSDLAAEDIKSCGNACDAYSKKSFASKLVRSRTWDRRFTEFIEIFQERRKEFDYTLSMSSSLTIFEVNQQVTSTEKKVDEVLRLLRAAWPPEFRKYKKLLIDSKNDDEKLKSTLKDHPFLYMSDIEVKSKATEGELANKKLHEAIEELKENVQDTLEDERKNMRKFEQLFELQRRHIEDVKNVVVRESDRTIDELTKAINGPVDRIIDRDIHAIWLEGGWKGNVKARHFILALRDYFHEKDEVDKKSREQGANPTSTTSDKWAYQYIDVPYLQPILEAIDDDASGFIRISEVNVFTTSRPKGWSLPRWIAFWAVGWLAFARKECSKINDIFGEMFTILPDIKQENQLSAEVYLSAVWKEVSELIFSLANAKETSSSDSDDLDNKFAAYAEAEEERLKSSLELIHYDIDDLGTLEAVIGSGRIEKNVFLLLRLVLDRHLKLFELCKNHILNPYELVDATGSILCVMGAVRSRYQDLKTLFANQRLDPKLQLRAFEYGIFKYIDDSQSLWPGGLSICEHNGVLDDSDSDEEVGEGEDSDGDQPGAHIDRNTSPPPGTDSNANAANYDTSIVIYPMGKSDTETLDFDLRAECDCCNEPIANNRIVCLDCVSSEGLWNTVDFCTKPSCVRRQVVVGRTDLLKEHNTQHNLLMLGKIPHVILVLVAFYLKGEKSIYGQAMKKIWQTQKHLTDPGVLGSVQAAECCTGCKQPVSLPCWTCLSCPEDDDEQTGHDEPSEHDAQIEQIEHTEYNGQNAQQNPNKPTGRYICPNCIANAEGLDDRYHMFVRCPPEEQDNEDNSIENIVMRLDARLSRVEESQVRLEGRLEALLDRLEHVV